VEPEEQRRLVERARNGDSDAWVTIYEAVYPRLLGFARRQGGYDVADDLVNETLARAVAGIDRFRWQSAPFDAWLFGILRRICADHHRGMRNVKRGIKIEVVEPDRSSDDLLRSEEHHELKRAFNRLTADERQVLELRVIAGLSAEDVGRLLGKRAGAVRTAQSRALAHLRQLLELSR
jgi:RNA polymerase sigma-70 factor (ECF subfamily)